VKQAFLAYVTKLKSVPGTNQF